MWFSVLNSETLLFIHCVHLCYPQAPSPPSPLAPSSLLSMSECLPVSVLGIYPDKAAIQKDICTSVFIATLVTIPFNIMDSGYQRMTVNPFLLGSLLHNENDEFRMCHAKPAVGSTSLSPHRGSLKRGSLVGTLHCGDGDVEKLTCPVRVSGQSQDPSSLVFSPSSSPVLPSAAN